MALETNWFLSVKQISGSNILFLARFHIDDTADTIRPQHF